MDVKKRDGRIVEWDATKIERAVRAAGLPEVEVETVVDDVCQIISNTLGEVLDIELIQDTVENALMTGGYESVARSYILYRDSHAKLRLRASGLVPDKECLANYIHEAKYARWDSKLSRRETYLETVARVEAMHLRKFPEYVKDITKAFDLVRAKRVLPSMRSMQFGGKAIEVNNARIYNCSYTLVDRVRVFGDIFWLLLSGCGVGASVQFHHVEKLPAVKKINFKHVVHWQVQDSIEGWADCLKQLYHSYFVTGDYLEPDYSQVRDEGRLLNTSGGKAPGHIPLRNMVETLRSLLNKAAGRQLRPIEVGDMICFIAIAVLSGGIRRSSLILIFSPEDGEMTYAKSSSNFQYNGLNFQREMSNNSAAISRAGGYPAFKRLFMTAVSNYGDPGFFFTDNPNHGTNPCGEIGLDPVSKNGETGFAFCNLCEINGALCETEEQFFEAVQAATLIGTLQATYTRFDYLGPVSESICRDEALLGVGITGIMDSPKICLNPETQITGASLAVSVNRLWARRLGIKRAARITTVKPSGTASLELGCIGSGIHPHHAKRYFRRVTANPNETVAQYFKSVNPHMVETKPNGDWCITFPVQAPDGAITVKDLSASKFLDSVFSTYDNWIVPGTVDLDTGLTHNVSCTVVVGEEDGWENVCKIVYENRARVNAMSFLERMGDKMSPWMPREEVTTELDEEKWRVLIENYKPVDWTKMVEMADGTEHVMEPACAGGSCEVR